MDLSVDVDLPEVTFYHVEGNGTSVEVVGGLEVPYMHASHHSLFSSAVAAWLVPHSLHLVLCHHFVPSLHSGHSLQHAQQVRPVEHSGYPTDTG